MTTSTRPSTQPSASTGKATEIAVGSKVVGEISGGTGLRVNGEVDGKINVDSEVVVEAGGVVRGEIRARVVKVSGRVIGNVRGLESVSIAADGRLEGDVVAPGLSIADGAFFKGKVEMAGEPDRSVDRGRPERANPQQGRPEARP